MYHWYTSPKGLLGIALVIAAVALLGFGTFFGLGVSKDNPLAGVVGGTVCCTGPMALILVLLAIFLYSGAKSDTLKDAQIDDYRRHHEEFVDKTLEKRNKERER